MAAITQVRGFGAFTGQPYGSFAAKTPSIMVTHNWQVDLQRAKLQKLTLTAALAGNQPFNILSPKTATVGGDPLANCHGLEARMVIRNNRGAALTVTATWNAIWKDTTGYVDPTNGQASISEWYYDEDLDEMVRTTPFTVVTV